MLFHPLGCANGEIFWSQYRQFKPFIPESLPQRALALVSLATRSPFYQAERWLYGSALNQQPIESGPFFIVGHWRSGTTHLHHLLSADDQFGYLTMAQMVSPHDALLSRYIPLIPFLLSLNLPENRGIDGMKLTIHSPQEEEISLGILSGISYYNCYYFPDQFESLYRQAIGFEGLTDTEQSRLKNAYLHLARKLTFANEGKPLLFKNPSSTSRLTFLKEIFPAAKFIHISRNPYQVFASSRNRLPKMVQGFRWQKGEDLDYDRLTIDGYRLLMERYLQQRHEIPQDDLFETSYEQLTAAPEETITQIYQAFGIPRSRKALDRFKQYLESQKNYRKNRYEITPSQLETIEREWAFALQEWNYQRPDDLVITQ